MTEGSKFLLHVLVGITGLWLLVFVLSLGPLGWFLIAFLVLAQIAYAGWNGDGATPDRTNCADCGAPNEPTRETCKYCDAAL